MASELVSLTSLASDLAKMGISNGDGLFVHASLKSIGPVDGGAASVVKALVNTVGTNGLIAMPGFSADAYLPSEVDRDQLTDKQIAEIEANVTGFNPKTSPTFGMGAIAEAFRKWPNTIRSTHPTVSICLHGTDALDYAKNHSLAWATGEDTPLGRLRFRPSMKILLIGVGWNRCSALHTAEYFANPRRMKVRRFKPRTGQTPFIETPDVADDMDRLFPHLAPCPI